MGWIALLAGLMFRPRSNRCREGWCCNTPGPHPEERASSARVSECGWKYFLISTLRSTSSRRKALSSGFEAVVSAKEINQNRPGRGGHRGGKYVIPNVLEGRNGEALSTEALSTEALSTKTLSTKTLSTEASSIWDGEASSTDP